MSSSCGTARRGRRTSSRSASARPWGLTEPRVATMRPGAPVMHPGPMNEGVEIDAAVAHGARSLIEEQVTNGVAVRMALLYLLIAGGEPPASPPLTGVV